MNKRESGFTAIFTLFAIALFSLSAFPQRIHLNGPSGSVQFGLQVSALPNGNTVVTDPYYSIPGGPPYVGAVYLYDGSNGNLISTLTGSTEKDFVGGGGITVLPSGNYVVRSPHWDRGKIVNAGAVTFCSGTSGVSGTVSVENSLVGSTAEDKVGGSYDDVPDRLDNFPGVTALPNGNYVVRSPYWDNGAIENAGAVTFGNGEHGIAGPVSETNSLVGSSQFDSVGLEEITILTNGNYVISSPYWNNGPATDAGAVTFGSGTMGVSGQISPENSLVGSTSGDYVGALLNYDEYGRPGAHKEITVLANGNYVVASPLWNGTAPKAGAVTFGDGTSGVTGVVSAANSLVGSAANDIVGGIGRFGFAGAIIQWSLITPLSNGNYVVGSPYWNNGAAENAGAATFGNGSYGVSGVVSADNSLVGSQNGDGVGGVAALSNGNYVVTSPSWNNGSVPDAGAVTFGNGTYGVSGSVSEANSLVGLQAGDRVGYGGITPLSNGNYVISSPSWTNKDLINAGAVSFGNGTTGVAGAVSEDNSLVGSTEDARVGSNGVTALKNGNYVVKSPEWDYGDITNVGAVTFGDGTQGVTGIVSAANSLVGSTAEDRVGGTIYWPGGHGSLGVTALANGNYAVRSPHWDNGTVVDAGAVTFGNGTTGITGVVSTTNSLVGSTGGDLIGNGGITALSNGNYVVYSEHWSGKAQHVGAVTFGNGTTGISGVLSEQNSLVGSSQFDGVGIVTALSNGNYVIKSPGWDHGAMSDAGAVTFGSGVTGISGAVSPANSMIGSSANDRVGDGGITELPNGAYVVNSYRWDNGDSVDAGAISYLRGPTSSPTAISSGDQKNRLGFPVRNQFDTGLTIELSNSVMGKTTGGGRFMNFAYDAVNDQLVIGCPYDNVVTLLRLPAVGSAPFDFDGDGRTDPSVYRPNSSSQWWIYRSSDAGNTVYEFGSSTDSIAAADYTGDGKTDVAFWRPSTGEWFILRSEDNSFYAFPFGANGDIPSPGDFDGDGKADPAVFRPSSGTWFIFRSSDSEVASVHFGVAEDKPTVADFDGDGTDDVAVFRPSVSQWWQLRSTEGVKAYGFGETGDRTAVGDWTGDGKADVAFYRPSTSEFYVIRSEDDSFFAFSWGAGGDIPTPGDFDGDGTTDPTVWRPSNSTWYILGSTSGFQAIPFGTEGDVPVPSVTSRQ